MLDHPALLEPEGLELAETEVGEDVRAGQLRDGPPPVHVARRSRRSPRRRASTRRPEGRRPAERVAVERMRPFQQVPPVVLSARRACRLEVDLLPRALADVADPQVAGRRGRTSTATGCAGRTPRSPASRRRGRRTGCPRGSGTELPVGPRVDPQHLAEQRRERLRRCPRVAAAAAVAEPDVEVSVGAEREVAAVVVRVRLVDEQDVAPRRPIAPRRPRIANPVTCVSPFVSV